jgi:hypothetical protein
VEHVCVKGGLLMKYRTGFVSNSSSSSFICDISGRSESGWDMCFSDVGMYSCENGHTFDEDYALYSDEIKIHLLEELKDTILEYHDEDLWESLQEADDITDFHDIDDFVYELPECCCPICTFKVYSESDMKRFMKKKYGTSEEDAFAEVKALNKRRKKLYDTEYVTYVCKTENTTVDAEFDEMQKFGVYSKFREYLNS